MKRIIILAISILMAAGYLPLASKSAIAAGCEDATVPLYALTKPSGRHFYTTNGGEVAQVMQYGFRFEGVVALIFAQPSAGTVPLRRYYNAANGAHRYFASSSIDNSKGVYEGEMGYVSLDGNSEIINSIGFRVSDTLQDVAFSSETFMPHNGDPKLPLSSYNRSGILGYTCTSGISLNPQNTIYRYWNPKSQKHFYTTSKDEGSALVKNAGFKYEGIAGYLYGDNKGQAAGEYFGVYRMYNAQQNKHLYTTNEEEKAALMQNGYRFEGTMGFTSGPYRGLNFHRLYNPKTNDHLFTTDNLEKDRAKQSGYIQEAGINFINPHMTKYPYIN